MSEATDATIVFRDIRKDGDATFWYVEAYSPEVTMFPAGTAYVIESKGTASLELCHCG